MRRHSPMFGLFLGLALGATCWALIAAAIYFLLIR